MIGVHVLFLELVLAILIIMTTVAVLGSLMYHVLMAFGENEEEARKDDYEPPAIREIEKRR